MAAAGYGTIQQRATSNAPPADDSQLTAPATATATDDCQTRKYHRASPFSIPSSTEAAALRVTRNLSHCTLHYTHFVWIVLFIALIPKRKVALIYMVIMTYIASLYLLVLQTFPAVQSFLHKLVDKRLVLSLLVVVTMVELIFNGAALHLIITLAATTPLVLVHASLWIGEDVIVVAGDKEAAGLLPVVQQQESHQGNR